MSVPMGVARDDAMHCRVRSGAVCRGDHFVLPGSPWPLAGAATSTATMGILGASAEL